MSSIAENIEFREGVKHRNGVKNFGLIKNQLWCQRSAMEIKIKACTYRCKPFIYRLIYWLLI